MMKGRGALLGACLALPFVFQAGAAGAAQPEGGHYVYVPAGATVVVLPAPEIGGAAEPGRGGADGLSGAGHDRAAGPDDAADDGGHGLADGDADA